MRGEEGGVSMLTYEESCNGYSQISMTNIPEEPFNAFSMHSYLVGIINDSVKNIRNGSIHFQQGSHSIGVFVYMYSYTIIALHTHQAKFELF